jgi:Rod binding domain-containing protein
VSILSGILNIAGQAQMGNPMALAGKAALDAVTSRSSSDPKLKKAASDFETLLLSSMLDEMKTFSDSLGGDGDPAANTIQGLGINAAASAIAKAGGVGIGQMVLQQLQRPKAGTGGPGGN